MVELLRNTDLNRARIRQGVPAQQGGPAAILPPATPGQMPNMQPQQSGIGWPPTPQMGGPPQVGGRPPFPPQQMPQGPPPLQYQPVPPQTFGGYQAYGR